MREMVLNHASLARAKPRKTDAWLKDVAVGIAELIQSGGVQSVLRTDRHLYDIPCPTGRSLWEALEQLRQQVDHPDEVRILWELLTKCSHLDDVDLSTCDPVRCEAETPPKTIEFGTDRRYDVEDGRPLVYCAINDGIAVSFPSERVWSADRLTVVFDELSEDDDDEIGRKAEAVDNLSRSSDASTICDRDGQFERSPAEVWRRRKENFPNLRFGMDVEGHLKRQAGQLRTIVHRLAKLNDSAKEWKNTCGPDPPWKIPVVPESDSVMKNEGLREARRFCSCSGERVLFELHARYGNGGRIHLRFDADAQTVEIGYIGPHLPL